MYTFNGRPAPVEWPAHAELGPIRGNPYLFVMCPSDYAYAYDKNLKNYLAEISEPLWSLDNATIS